MPADKAKFQADAKNQKDKYFAFLTTDAGKKAVAARREALKANKIKEGLQSYQCGVKELQAQVHGCL